MSPNNGTLPDEVLRPKLLNNTFTSCPFKKLDFLLAQTEHFYYIIIPLFFVFKIFQSNFSFFFCTLTQHVFILQTNFRYRCFKPDVCFKKFDLLEPQTVHNVLYDSFLINNATTLIFVLSVFFLQTKQ